jgi:hypothetical protein
MHLLYWRFTKFEELLWSNLFCQLLLSKLTLPFCVFHFGTFVSQRISMTHGGQRIFAVLVYQFLIFQNIWRKLNRFCMFWLHFVFCFFFDFFGTHKDTTHTHTHTHTCTHENMHTHAWTHFSKFWKRWIWCSVTFLNCESVGFKGGEKTGMSCVSLLRGETCVFCVWTKRKRENLSLSALGPASACTMSESLLQATRLRISQAFEFYKKRKKKKKKRTRRTKSKDVPSQSIQRNGAVWCAILFILSRFPFVFLATVRGEQVLLDQMNCFDTWEDLPTKTDRGNARGVLPGKIRLFVISVGNVWKTAQKAKSGELFKVSLLYHSKMNRVHFL